PPTRGASDLGRQGARAPQNGKIVRALRCKITRNLAGAAEDRLADLRSRNHVIVEDDGEQLADILLRRLAKTLRSLRIEAERYDGFVGALVERRLRVDEVLAGD